MQKHVDIKSAKHFVKVYLKPLLNYKLLKMILPDKPTSKNQ